MKLVNIHCTQPGFRRYGRAWEVSTLVEISGSGEVSKGSPAACALTPAQLGDLERWIERNRGKSPLTCSDPDAATARASEIERQLSEARQHLAALERQRTEARQQVEEAEAERAALRRECDEVAKQLAEMRQQVEERERAVAALEAKVAEQQQLLEELSAGAAGSGKRRGK